MNIAEISVKRPTFIMSIIILIFFTGYVSLRNLPVSLFPETNVPFVSIVTYYPGAGPKEVENSISKILEDELSTVESLKNITTISQASVSIIWLEFKSGSNLDSLELRIRDKLAIIKNKLPKEAESPLLERYNPSSMPVIMGFLAPINGQSISDLSLFIDKEIRPKILQTDKVGKLEIGGEIKKEVQIKVNSKNLEKYHLTMTQIYQALQPIGVNVPVGSLNSSINELSVRTLGEVSTLDEIKDKIISFGNGEKSILLSKIAEVNFQDSKVNQEAYLDGKAGVVFKIYKQTGANTVSVANAVKLKIEELNKLYPNYQLKIFSDGSKTIRDNIMDVWESIVIGIFLTIVVVYFFLGSFRSTLITGFAIPNSLFGAFILISISGFSINILTLLALSLSVGLLIDDAIVVRENIFKYIEKGLETKEASIKGTNEVAMAVLAVTLATVSMFGPVGFLKGVTGQFFKEFGLVICFAMIVSYFDAMFAAPMFSAYFGEKNEHHSKLNYIQKIQKRFDNFQMNLESYYLKILNITTQYPLRTIVIIFSFAILLSSVVVRIPSSFLPVDQSREFDVSIKLPANSSLENTSMNAKKIEKIVREDSNVETTLLTVSNEFNEKNRANIKVKLKKNLKETPFEIRQYIKAKIENVKNDYKEIDVNIYQNDVSGSGGRALSFLILGSDSKIVKDVSKKIFNELKDKKELIGLEIVGLDSTKELQIKFNDSQMHRYGINPLQVGFDSRLHLEGEYVGKLKSNENNFKILLKSDQNINDWNSSSHFLVPNVNYTPVNMKSFTSIKEEEIDSKIERLNRSYSIRIQSDLDPSADLSLINSELEKILSKYKNLDQSLKIKYEGDAESFNELSDSMSYAFLFGIVLLFLVLASLYESFILSLLNIISLPLALSGAFFLLWLTNQGLNIYSIIGILLLLGVATKNSIMLIDSAKSHLDDGKKMGINIVQIISESAVRRMRPILMTSGALLAGCIPIAIGLNEASAQRTGMGIAIIGGVITSTVFTLFFVPSIMVIYEKYRK